jgi:hypothetical protein
MRSFVFIAWFLLLALWFTAYYSSTFRLIILLIQFCVRSRYRQKNLEPMMVVRNGYLVPVRVRTFNIFQRGRQARGTREMVPKLKISTYVPVEQMSLVKRMSSTDTSVRYGTRTYHILQYCSASPAIEIFEFRMMPIAYGIIICFLLGTSTIGSIRVSEGEYSQVKSSQGIITRHTSQ